MNEYTLRGRILGRDRLLDVVVKDGRVATIRTAGSGKADFGHDGAVFGVPLVDIQVNGAAGIDLQSPTLSVDDVAALTDYMLAQGVAKWVPTLITGSVKVMERNCRVLAEAMADRTLARHIPGIHLEGPFISPDDGARGAHPRQHVRKPDIALFDRLLKAADGKVLYTTIAPDQPGSIPFIKAIVKRGVVVSLGHHMAPADTIHAAAKAGATLCTHLGNGLAANIHRHYNPLWPQLADDRLSASLIADLHHLTPDMLHAFIAAKGRDRVILTSDSMHIAGLKPGKYQVGGHEVELTKAQRINLLGTQLLAGSALQLLQGVENTARFGGLTLAEAFDAASRTPARLLGVTPPRLRLERGAKPNALLYAVDGKKGARVIASVHRGIAYT